MERSRFLFNTGVADLAAGMIVGVILSIGREVLIVFTIVAAALSFILIAAGHNLSTYGNNEEGGFTWTIVLMRIIIANIGVVIGRLMML